MKISGQIVNRPNPTTTKIPREPFKGVSGSRGSKGSNSKALISRPKRTTTASTPILSKATNLSWTPTGSKVSRIQKLTTTSLNYSAVPFVSRTTKLGIRFSSSTATSNADFDTFKTGIETRL